MKARHFISAAILLCVTAGAPISAQVRAQVIAVYPLWNFDEENHSCRAKGRLQDKEHCQSRMMDWIVRDGKNAVPVLIEQLSDSRRLEAPIFDSWSRMTVSDVAYFILSDLFTEPDGRTFNLPGVPRPDASCGKGAEACWRAFVKMQGRESIQSEWRTAWEAHKDQVYWDEDARCFRLRKTGPA